jgi:hypothetical protein
MYVLYIIYFMMIHFMSGPSHGDPCRGNASILRAFLRCAMGHYFLLTTATTMKKGREEIGTNEKAIPGYT